MPPLFLLGGPSQLETFDLKPDAPEKIRAPFRPVASRTPGLRNSEALPRLAAVSAGYAEPVRAVFGWALCPPRPAAVTPTPESPRSSP